MTRASWPVDPAQVALGELPAGERAQAEELLRSDAGFREAVARQRTLVDRVTALRPDDWLPGDATPPALDLERALATRAAAPARSRRGWLGGRAQDLPPHAAGKRRGRAAPSGPVVALRPALAAFCALALLLVGGSVGVLLRGGAGPASPVVATGADVALRAFPGGGEPAAARASVTLPGRAGGEVHLQVHGARPTPAGHLEEVWFMSDAKRLVSVGTYRVGPDGSADVRFHTAADPRAYRYVDVSLEPEDGNPAHSRDSVLRSRAAPA